MLSLLVPFWRFKKHNSHVLSSVVLDTWDRPWLWTLRFTFRPCIANEYHILPLWDVFFFFPKEGTVTCWLERQLKIDSSHGSYQWQFCPWGMFGDIFLLLWSGVGGLLLTFSEKRPELPLCLLQYAQYHLQWRIIWLKMSVMPRLRNPELSKYFPNCPWNFCILWKTSLWF